MDVDEGSDQNSDLALLYMFAWAFIGSINDSYKVPNSCLLVKLFLRLIISLQKIVK